MKSYTVGNNSTYENKSGIVPHYEGFFKEKNLTLWGTIADSLLEFPTMQDRKFPGIPHNALTLWGSKDKTITLLSILPSGEEFHLMISYVVRKNDD